MSCIVRNGRRIAIDTINTTTPARKKRKPFEVSFVKLPNFWIDAATPCPETQHRNAGTCDFT